MNDDLGSSWSRNVDVVADAGGQLSDSFTLPDWFVATYSVVATGGQSGTVTTTFTDGNVKFDVAPAGNTATFVENMYSTTNCSGAARTTGGFPKTLTAINGDTVGGVASSESVRIDAAALSDQGNTFSAWSSTDSPASSFTVIFGTGGKSICITGFSGSGTQNYRATYAAVANTAPVLAAIGNKNVNEGSALGFTATATDADVPANTLTFSLVNGSTSCGTVTSCTIPAGASITSGGVFSWTPTEAQGPGTYRFFVKVTDNGTPVMSDDEEITVTVAEVNVAPVLGTIGDQNVNEGSALGFTATATDADVPANTLTFSLADGTAGDVPTGASITAGGVFSWTPTEAQGPGVYTFDVVVSDGTLTDFETIDVTVAEVNVAPVLGTIGDQNVNEGSALSFTATATDADVPANTLTFSLADGTLVTSRPARRSRQAASSAGPRPRPRAPASTPSTSSSATAA